MNRSGIMDKNNFNINYSWTQPYHVSTNPFYQKSSPQEEMEKIEMVDRWVDVMKSYPDAERLLKNIFSY